MNKSKKNERLGSIKVNKWGDTMKIIEYNGANDIVVEFQDEWEETKKCLYKDFSKGSVINPHTYKKRIGMTKQNKQGHTMKVIDYIDSNNVIVEFQDAYKEIVRCNWNSFVSGSIKNHYAPFVCGVGMSGSKYPTVVNGKRTKEYLAWNSMLTRCYTKTIVNNENYYSRYEKVEVCDDWLLFEKFYEWIHEQENFSKWLSGDKWEIDKDILFKGNKIYSPDTCVLVPHNINSLFIKSNKARGKYPIGVTYKTRDGVFEAQCNVNGKETYIGRFHDEYSAFLAYKKYKESLIKQIAQEEFDKCNITKECYEAMMRYEVEITD